MLLMKLFINKNLQCGLKLKSFFIIQYILINIKSKILNKINKIKSPLFYLFYLFKKIDFFFKTKLFYKSGKKYNMPYYVRIYKRFSLFLKILRSQSLLSNSNNNFKFNLLNQFIDLMDNKGNSLVIIKEKHNIINENIQLLYLFNKYKKKKNLYIIKDKYLNLKHWFFRIQFMKTQLYKFSKKKIKNVNDKKTIFSSKKL